MISNSRLQYLEFEVTVGVDVLGGVRILVLDRRRAVVEISRDIAHGQVVDHQVVHRRLERVRIVVENIFLRLAAI